MFRGLRRRLGLAGPPHDEELEARLPRTILGQPTGRLTGDAAWAASVEPSVRDFARDVGEYLGLPVQALSVGISGIDGGTVRAWRWRGADYGAVSACLELQASLGVAPIGSGDQLQEICGVRVVRTFTGERSFDMSGATSRGADSDDVLALVRDDTWFEIAVPSGAAEDVICQIAGPDQSAAPPFELALPAGWVGSTIRAADLWEPRPELVEFADRIEPGWPKLAEIVRPTPTEPLFGPMGNHPTDTIYLAADLRQRSAVEGHVLLAVRKYPAAYGSLDDEVAAGVERARLASADITARRVELTGRPAFQLEGSVEDGDDEGPSRISHWITRSGHRTFHLTAQWTDPADPVAIQRAILETFRVT